MFALIYPKFRIEPLFITMKQYSEEELQQALQAILSGQTIKRAAIEHGIPRSTLQNRIKGQQPRSEAFSDFQRLRPVQEELLTTWILTQAALGLPPSHAQVKEFAERILRAQGDSEPLGKRWLQAFLRRNPAVQVQKSRSIDSQRVNGASVEVIRPWFRYLQLPEIQRVKPANRHNMDEAGLLEGAGSNGLVLGGSEKRSVRKKQPGSRAWTSFIECIST